MAACGDLWPLSGFIKGKWPAHAGIQTQDSELVEPLGYHLPKYGLIILGWCV